VEFGSSEWFGLFKHMCAEAHRLGLEVNMNNDAGWSGSGGPWITPALSMQKLVWTETTITGPTQFNAVLPHPETYSNYYRDITVLAVPAADASTVNIRELPPKVTASTVGPDFKPANLLDGNPTSLVTLPRPEPGKPQFLQLEFAQPFRARRLMMTLPGLSSHKMCSGIIQTSDDGQSFDTIRDFDAESSMVSLNFPETSARIFRIQFNSAEPYLEQLNIAEVELSPECRIDSFEQKALFVPKKENPEKTNYAVLPASMAILPHQITNLSSSFHEGWLSWNVPSGTWSVLRFGHTSTGEENQPAPAGGQGLECDKLSKQGAEAMFNGLIAKLIKQVGPLAGKTFVAAHIDSWEVGAQNWTARFREEFQRLRGYDPVPFLPVMTGRVVDTLEVSERFLWDLRQTASQLLVENYAGHMRELAHQHGMRLTLEAYDLAPTDDLLFASRADEPMAEFWTWPSYAVAYSCIEMASAAHVYGKKIVGVEAFTATDVEKWIGHPFAVKVYGDWAFCHGMNRFVLHRYAHQPWTAPQRVPGMTMGPWGLHYERTQTWWEQSKPWHEYLARCQYLLQQGLFNADICYLAPEDVPMRWQVPGRSRERPGYNYDACPGEVVLTRMSVQDGKLVLPDGMHYRLLVLPDSETMSPKLLARIKELVKEGATVLGPRPLRSPGLSDYPKCDDSVRSMAANLWGDCDGKAIKEHRFGKGRVVMGLSPQEVLRRTDVPTDFAAQSQPHPEAIRYIHKTLGDTEVYFVANKFFEPENAVCSFRVENRAPEFWRPDTGKIEHPAVYETGQGTVQVPIHFDSFGSLFVIFRRATPGSGRITLVRREGREVLSTRFDTPTSSTSLSDGIDETKAGVTNTFTFAAWVRPEMEIDLPPERTGGISGLHVIRNDALYPPPGEDLYPEPRQAGSGLSVGLNGVCVYEHAANYFAPTLVCPARITNWTHVAVVYRDEKPSVYINGKFLHEGIRSEFNVHSGVGVKHHRGVGPFRGAVGEFQDFAHALTEADLVSLAKRTAVPKLVSEIQDIELTRDGKNRLKGLVSTPGQYGLNTASGGRLGVSNSELPPPLQLIGPWQLRFPAGWGAPEKLVLQDLISWSEHADAGVKYFSGAGTYYKEFKLGRDFLAKDRRLFLNLGKVAVIAEVKLNRKRLETLWKPPFELDVTDILKSGNNSLEVKIVNLWPNRMIGDEQFPPDSIRKPNGTLDEWPQWLLEQKESPAGRFTFSTWQPWKKDSPLQRSGLLGPVTIRAAKVITVQE
jgi:hypothetical protein